MRPKRGTWPSRSEALSNGGIVSDRSTRSEANQSGYCGARRGGVARGEGLTSR